MKMTMINAKHSGFAMCKHLLPIILALSAPAAAQECQTPAQVDVIALGAGGVKYADVKKAPKEFIVYKFDDGLFDIVVFENGCFVSSYGGQTQDQVNKGLTSLGIKSAE